MVLLAESAMEEMINEGYVSLNSIKAGLNWLDDKAKAEYSGALKAMVEASPRSWRYRN